MSARTPAQVSISCMIFQKRRKIAESDDNGNGWWRWARLPPATSSRASHTNWLPGKALIELEAGAGRSAGSDGESCPTSAASHSSGRAHAASLAGERDQEVVAAVAAPRTRKATGEDATGRPKSLEALLDAALEHALARVARPVPRGCEAPGGALDLHARPLCPVPGLGLSVADTRRRSPLATARTLG